MELERPHLDALHAAEREVEEDGLLHPGVRLPCAAGVARGDAERAPVEVGERGQHGLAVGGILEEGAVTEGRFDEGAEVVSGHGPRF